MTGKASRSCWTGSGWISFLQRASHPQGSGSHSDGGIAPADTPGPVALRRGRFMRTTSLPTARAVPLLWGISPCTARSTTHLRTTRAGSARAHGDSQEGGGSFVVGHAKHDRGSAGGAGGADEKTA